jgi:hypothetical protein
MAALAVLGGYGSSEDSDDEAGASVSSDLFDRVAAVQRDEVPRHTYCFWSGNLPRGCRRQARAVQLSGAAFTLSNALHRKCHPLSVQETAAGPNQRRETCVKGRGAV